MLSPYFPHLYHTYPMSIIDVAWSVMVRSVQGAIEFSRASEVFQHDSTISCNLGHFDTIIYRELSLNTYYRML